MGNCTLEGKVNRLKMNIPGFSARWLPAALFTLAAVLSAGLVTAPVAYAQDGPTIDVWYGLNQTFGLPGEPQIWCDIQGNVSDPDGVASLSYTLNGGAPVDMTIGPDGRRLINSGDFVVDLLVADLQVGANSIEISAIDGNSNASMETVILNYSAGNSWPTTYSTDWGALVTDGDPMTPDPAILEQAHVVDGSWTVIGDSIRTIEPGYDRLIGLGELGWGDYEVTVPVTIHEILNVNEFGVGLIFRWNGHTDYPDYCVQPLCGWLPLGDIGWLKNGRLNLWDENENATFPVNLDTVYWLKMRVETNASGALYSLKAWEDGQVEPDWMITDQRNDNYPMAGSLLLVAHFADASFGNVSIVPITSPNDPPVANDVAADAKFNGTSFIDILFNDTDIDGVINPASVSIVNPPTNGTIVDIDPMTGIVEYLHGGNANPTDTFTYTVEDNDGAVSNVATVTLTILPNQAPVANDDEAIVKIGKSVAVNVPANDTDIDGTLDLTTVTIVAGPLHGTIAGIDPSTGVVSYDQDLGIATADSFTYTIDDDDGETSNVANVVLTINPNLPPVAHDDVAFAAFDFPSRINVLANDTDSDGTIDPTSVVVLDAPQNGFTSVDPATGVVTYTHTALTSEPDSFTYTVEDDSGDLSNLAMVRVTVGQEAPEDFYSDDFNSCGVDPMWTFIDPQGDAPDPVITGAFTGDAQVAISVPGGSTHQPYDDYLGAPYILQAAQDKDFTLDVKFSSTLPDSAYALQGVLVRQDDLNWMRFDFYSNTSSEIIIYGSTNTKDDKFGNIAVGIPGDSPLYMRVQRTGDDWSLYYSTNGVDWILAGSKNHPLTVTGVGLFAGNAGSSAPAFTTFVDYFSNSVDPVVEPDDQDQNSLFVTVVGSGTVDKSPDQAVYACGEPVELTAFAGADYVFLGWSGDLTGTDNPATITMDRPRYVTAVFQSIHGQPVGVTDLAFNKVMTGNPAGNSTAVDLSWTPSVDPSVVSVSVYRKGFGSYPEYSDGGGSAPVLPTDPIAEGWELVASVPVGTNSTTAQPTTRDYWYFCAQAVNGLDNISDAVMTGGVLNYLLGDVSDGGAPPLDGDNSVLTGDLTLLGAHYGTMDGDGLYLNTLDIGPSSDLSVDGLPTTDNLIEFEDLMLFGLNYGVDVGAAAKILDFANVPPPAPSNIMALHLPDLPEIGQTFQANLVMAGDGRIQGLKIPLVWDADVVEPLTVQGGPLLTEQGGSSLTLSAAPGVVDVCLAGIRESGISGVGEIASVTFQVLATGDPGIQLADIDARDQTNNPVPVTTTAASPVGDGGNLPVVSVLHPNYPNPFNPMTTIAFDLAVSGRVRIDIFSIDGRRIRTLVDGIYDVGRHSEVWNGRDQTGRSVASGTYLFIMEGPRIKQARRMLLIK